MSKKADRPDREAALPGRQYSGAPGGRHRARVAGQGNPAPGASRLRAGGGNQESQGAARLIFYFWDF